MADDEHQRRNGDGKVQWQVIAVIASLLMALTSAAGTWFVNSYRLEQVEKQLIVMDAKVERLDERLVKLQTTYDILVDQAREHGWIIPWQGRRR